MSEPKPLYNPGNGNRLDLVVFEEPEAVALARWAKARRAYLESLIADVTTSADAKVIYAREMNGLA